MRRRILTAIAAAAATTACAPTTLAISATAAATTATDRRLHRFASASAAATTASTTVGVTSASHRCRADGAPAKTVDSAVGPTIAPGSALAAREIRGTVAPTVDRTDSDAGAALFDGGQDPKFRRGSYSDPTATSSAGVDGSPVDARLAHDAGRRSGSPRAHVLSPVLPPALLALLWLLRKRTFRIPGGGVG